MSRVLDIAREQAWAERAEQGLPGRKYRARVWCVDVLARRKQDWISEEEAEAARWASRAYLKREGLLSGSMERVDATNGAEARVLDQIASDWFGIERAIARRVVGRQTIPALIALCEGESLSGVAHACRFLRTSGELIRTDERTAEALVRLILMALVEYKEACVPGQITP